MSVTGGPVQGLLQAQQHRTPLGRHHPFRRGPLLLRLHKRQRLLLLLPSLLRPRFEGLQQRNPVAKPLLGIVALKGVSVDHRLPVVLLECCLGHPLGPCAGSHHRRRR